ncbi:N-alpha-acetyltransferase 60-like [Biomphalaria glabrata]|uniref:N-alpha-acetyltransferase 60 n=1 Tax=Biomphalaria glabrata TaxID=6526 RepID=A0A2C9JFF2_BIOGL|nr:N-alpha-acetyltransferase 60-like [Biomphalaria glabrata]XP_013069621.1 N-alpha-acetyltransferase 60-like [Biomphalaria glabrata]XP_013069630.1 N-alpha-acetyltransferase 60-like [Biomphalaria glabrata]XP_013069638.1 N-alpha-acetyltransferase 60-like [Biomphalaria glabrata]XP_013069646.1 N-alpha-acetyltransferase 60-like [Biomphalaria glabrata]XP_013069656.1 N-alpha-acetyltransferase 60-like [Biomphalaria glabrata]XP_013069664.1 N-alpha-acetyltransferase 60-like [Biomphalaria glabrata]XP_0
MSGGVEMTEKLPLSLSVQQEVQLRFLGPSDVTEVKKLCREWFPIEYPDSWYEEITSNSRFYSLAATHHARIVGLVVAELKPQAKLNKEDGDLLASYYPPTAQVAYILSLGVVGDFRRIGIASLLLDSLLSYLTSKDRHDCKAVYLHVLSTNTVALRFYERRRFRRHLFLPYYYAIQGKARDGYSYVLYINGGEPPWSIFDYLTHCSAVVTKLQPCAFPRQVYTAVRNIIQRMLSRSVTEVSHNS